MITYVGKGHPARHHEARTSRTRQSLGIIRLLDFQDLP